MKIKNGVQMEQEIEQFYKRFNIEVEERENIKRFKNSLSKILENRVINFMGNYSLELYLLHVYFMFSIFGLAEKFGLQLDRFNLCTNIFSIIFACAVSWIYSKIIAFAMSKIENYRRR